MKEQVSEILGDFKRQFNEYLQNPGVTEQYTARELTTYMSSKAFKYFEGNFPDQAKRIKASFAGKDLQSRALMFGLSLIFKNKKIKSMTPPMVATFISDFMSEVTTWLGSGESQDGAGLYPGLESKLLLVSAESLENYINWQTALSDEEFARVCEFLSTKSVEEIDALLQLDTEKRNKVMTAFLRLRQRPMVTATAGAQPEKAASPLLVSLRRMKGGLQVAHDRLVKPNTEPGQEGS